MNRLIEPLKGLPEYQELRERMRKTDGILSLTGCVEAQKAHMIYGLSYDVKKKILVAENDLAAKTLYENIRFYEPDAMNYPAKDLLFYQADIASNELDRMRVRVYRALVEKPRVTVVLPVAALMDFVTRRPFFEASAITLTKDREYDFEELKKNMVLLGYERCAAVEVPGQFSFRGDIVDIWDVTHDHPVRIEFFGENADSMRSFDPVTQRSVEEITSVTVYPANDHTGELAPFITWFDTKDTEIFLDEPNRLAEAARATEEEFRESVRHRAEDESFNPDDMPNMTGFEEITATLGRMHCISLSMLPVRRDTWAIKDTLSTTVEATGTYTNSFEFLFKDLTTYKKRGYKVIVLSASHTRARRLASEFDEDGLGAFYTEDTETPLSGGQIAILYGHASRGFAYPLIKFAVISETDIFGEKKTRRKKKKQTLSGQKIASFTDLSVGDYVVHEDHGLGIYRGIEHIEVDGVLKDYIKIEYNGSNLYILATQLDKLQKYASSDASSHPRLNKLGGREWATTKSHVSRSVKSIAKELVALYAAREQKKGFVYGPDTEWQREFEELFPYEETDDQLQAIEDTKRDMESTKIMDRLICGDVGYGKTEIAIRAAFKAVQDGKQVAYLVPTTILAQQHYNTFSQRMMDFPVRVDMLSRFRTDAQQTRTIKDLRGGLVDIVIGTHRLLSKDVQFKNLGLLIIDEEQRFGVAAKEKIKEMKKDVDVLTLTATPIPRTLHMSLIGIRDMSILDEPPQDRVAIQTYVMEFNPEMVREAICREVARHGQVYYVYNRVRDIAETAKFVASLVPEATVAYADGQMERSHLEDIMVQFVNGEIDVLVTTTIIETGLDIANANTMIIQDADRLGLAQLYQLRGRVGRSSRTSYAFLMYKKDKMLKEVAEKRLSAIREFTELGSGYKIAMRDLEIRGAGNLLGAEQSGHMESVGYDLYCKMLSDAVSEARGQKVEEDFETVVDLSLDAYIPDSYIPDEFQKLDFYKRIAAIESEEDREDISDELMDRYGPLPQAVRNLCSVAYIKAMAHRVSVTELKETGDIVRMTFLKKPRFDVGGVPAILAVFDGKITVRNYKGASFFVYHKEGNEKEMFEDLKTFLTQLAQTVK